jgi:hypothetical protein
MEKYTSVKALLSFLKSEKIKTWFDLGIFIDRIKEENEQIEGFQPGTYDDYINNLGDGGIAFLTFHYMVDEHINDCEVENKPVQKSYTGSFNVRLTPQMHRKLAETAIRKGITLNQLLKNAISKELETAITE